MTPQFRFLAATLAAATAAIAGTMSRAPAGEPGPYTIDTAAIGVAGISSGGYMTVQFQVAHADLVSGAGVVAGGPFGCAAVSGPNPFYIPISGYVTNALSHCVDDLGLGNPYYGGPPALQPLLDETRRQAGFGKIDPVEALCDDRVYLFSGTGDTTVPQPVMDRLEEYYRGLCADMAITYDKTLDAAHTWPTEDFGNACDVAEEPYISDCDLEVAGRILETIYGPLAPPTGVVEANLLEFDQHPAAAGTPHSIGLDDNGYLYVPTACQSGDTVCKLMVVFHGCEQSARQIGTTFIDHAGFNPYAESNDIIVLYPQTRPSEFFPYNPKGCWDLWGYTTADYYLQSGEQVEAVHHMVARLIGLES